MIKIGVLFLSMLTLPNENSYKCFVQKWNDYINYFIVSGKKKEVSKCAVNLSGVALSERQDGYEGLCHANGLCCAINV